jgi:hypothetical protein
VTVTTCTYDDGPGLREHLACTGGARQARTARFPLGWRVRDGVGRRAWLFAHPVKDSPGVPSGRRSLRCGGRGLGRACAGGLHSTLQLDQRFRLRGQLSAERRLWERTQLLLPRAHIRAVAAASAMNATDSTNQAGSDDAVRPGLKAGLLLSLDRVFLQAR